MNDRSTAEGILFTDQYHLTMAQLYFRLGMHERQAQFDHFFRNYPDYGEHRAGFCVNAGLEWLLDWMEEARFGEREISLLRGMTSRSGRRLFDEDFLSWLGENGDFSGISIQAVPEGRVVHAHVPLTVVNGPLALAQILETPLLNILNYQTLIATKAARVRESAGDALVLEFGVRRAHDRGGNAGTRAALIGGADFSSNAGVSHMLGYPPKGTHAHSLVQAFLAQGMTELDAFQAYADIYPDECLLLVDTIDTLESGVPNAIRVFERLRRKGYAPVGVRLDSGDLARLSTRVAQMLDEAGFPNASIVLSNELDELRIRDIRLQIVRDAAESGQDADSIINRLVYGVGTRLVTSAGDSSLGGVYKLVGLKVDKTWKPAIKVSEDPGKTAIPGNKRVWRIVDARGLAAADLLTLKEEDPAGEWQNECRRDSLADRPYGFDFHLLHQSHMSQRRSMPFASISGIEPLLTDVLTAGRLVYERPSLEAIRASRQADVAELDEEVRRLIDPKPYNVAVSESLWALQEKLLHTYRPAGLARILDQPPSHR